MQIFWLQVKHSHHCEVPTICYLDMYMGISGEDRVILIGLLCKP